MAKIKIGILFGGCSKEREVSFAGGRTVYDNLNKSLFEPVPLFVDSFGNFIHLKWQYIYKGSIRDFYPPVDFVAAIGDAGDGSKTKQSKDFHLYAESTGDLPSHQQMELTKNIGKHVK